MNFTKGVKLKLIEGPHGLFIVHEGVNVKDAQPLLMTDQVAPLLMYLDRYLFGRLNGEPLSTAHEAAMKEANVTIVLPASAAKTIPLTP